MLDSQLFDHPTAQRSPAADRRSWIVQRCAWAAMALVILAAVMGLFGPGLLGKVTAGQHGAQLRVEYYRFWRLKSPTSLRLLVAPEAVHNNQATVWLSRSYLDNISIQNITPQPERVEAGPDRLTFVFSMRESDRAAAITFDIRPESFGSLDGQAGIQDGKAVTFNQFVHP